MNYKKGDTLPCGGVVYWVGDNTLAYRDKKGKPCSLDLTPMSKEEFKAHSIACMEWEKAMEREKRAKAKAENALYLASEARRLRRAERVTLYVSCPVRAAHWELRRERRELVARRRTAWERLRLTLEQTESGLPDSVKAQGLSVLLKRQGKIPAEGRSYYEWDRITRSWTFITPYQSEFRREDRADSGSGYGRHAD